LATIAKNETGYHESGDFDAGNRSGSNGDENSPSASVPLYTSTLHKRESVSHVERELQSYRQAFTQRKIEQGQLHHQQYLYLLQEEEKRKEEERRQQQYRQSYNSSYNSSYNYR
jgi:hypothetical protein